MINKENNDKEVSEPPKEQGLIDTAKMEVQCHILIKDKDTNEIILNKRG